MPTYGYVCTECGHEFEELQSIKAEPLKKCPQCEKDALRRRIGTGAGVIFKGGGFYCTDYKGKNASSGSAAKKSCSCGCGGNHGAKSE